MDCSRHKAPALLKDGGDVVGIDFAWEQTWLVRLCLGSPPLPTSCGKLERRSSLQIRRPYGASHRRHCRCGVLTYLPVSEGTRTAIPIAKELRQKVSVVAVPLKDAPRLSPLYSPCVKRTSWP